MNQDQAKQKIAELIKKYEVAKSSGQDKKYTEEETKKDFILPLFQALGWDVYNKTEVSAEEHIKSSGRVDYGFYINGRTKFYLEAKPLRADLDDPKHARQAIKYSWNKGVTWAVLTDFENTKVFNAEFQSENLAHSKFFELSWEQYLDKFDQLWLLSRESFINGEIDKKAESWGKTLKRVSVTDSLYKDLTESRKLLTEGLKRWNDNLSEELLDDGVQKLLNRLIFIRVLEDRGIEPHILKSLVREWESGHYEKSRPPLYKLMVSKFRELDRDYNSNLFDYHPFEDWEETDNETKKVIDILYGKAGYYEYDFKIIPADVLGAVYENYLGYKLEQSKKKNKIGKDSKKRKEHGIYYTPEAIVNYIIQNALVPVLNNCHTIDDLMKIKVLDPACGSGSFLIKAVDAIYQRYYEFNYRGSSTYKKLQIITSNIYGVDLDQQAVEIARLNLLINAVEEKVILPSLAKIKNGNSLISGTDEELKKYFGKNYRDKKPFNWQEEFPEVFKQGGFDVVIGNPPYVSFYSKQSQADKETTQLLEYLIDRYRFIADKGRLGRFNTLMFFVERSLSLLKLGGDLGIIIDTNIHSNPSEDIRHYMAENFKIIEIIDEIRAFKEVASSQVILIIKNQKPDGKNIVRWSQSDDNNHFIVNNSAFQNSINTKNNFSFKVPVGDLSKKIIQTVEQNKNLAELLGKANIRTCITFTGQKDKFVVEEKEKNIDYPLLEGSFSVSSPYCDIKWDSYVRYDTRLRDKLNLEYKKFAELKNRRSPMVIGLGDIEAFKAPKIFIRLSDKRLTATFTEEFVCADLSLYIVTLPNKQIATKDLNLLFLLALFNSQLLTFYLINKGYIRNLTTGTPQIRLNDLRMLPIILPSKEKQTQMAEMAKKMLALKQGTRKVAENSNEWQNLKSEIAKTDQKIDEEVYKLYGLTEEEIKIVEGQN